MYDKVVKLKNMLKCDQFILTGSLAFKFHGLDVDCNDIDLILINPTNETRNLLCNLSNLFPRINGCQGKYSKLEANYQFVLDGVPVDIFIECNIKSCLQTKEGVDINPICDIIKAKMILGRIKDYKSLYEWSQKIFSNKTFK